MKAGYLWIFLMRVTPWPLNSVFLRLVTKRKSLKIAGRSLERFPLVVLKGAASHLNAIDFSKNCFTVIPKQISSLSLNLTHLVLASNKIKALPDEMGKLAKLQLLDVGYNQLEYLGEWLGDLTSLTNLNCMNNKLIAVPESLGNLEHLISLGLKSNQLTSLPSSIGNLTSLIHLFLTDNRLSTFPPEIARCVSLRKIQASMNDLKSLPETMATMKSLEFIRLACNAFQAPPPCLAAMPTLSWVNLAGNPCSDVCVKSRTQPLPVFTGEGDGLEITGRGLGALTGASGDMQWGSLEGRDVVIKFFRMDGDYVSPDGKPEDELKVGSFVDHHRIPQPLGLVQVSRSPGERVTGIPQPWGACYRYPAAL
ncbi:hypothetical protein CYMTET_4579, partial [Cymbomonas tetramitiformis]